MESPRSALAKSEAAIREALAIDAALDEAHYALGHNLFSYAWDWDCAERAFQRTLQLNPNHASALGLYGMMLTHLDRADEGIRLTQRAVDLEPIAPLCSHMLASALFAAGRFDEAIEQEHRTLELDSTYLGAYWILGLATMALGKYQEAVEIMQPGTLFADVLLTACLGHAQARAEQREDAEQILDRLQRRRRSRFTSPWGIATACIGLGRHDETMRWLETAYEERDPLLTMLHVWPLYDPLRSDPPLPSPPEENETPSGVGRIALIRRMNLPAQP